MTLKAMFTRRRLVIAVGLCLGGYGATAAAVTVTLEAGGVLASNNALYATYAQTCDPQLQTSTCGQDGGALDPGQTLFVWGANTVGTPGDKNSVRTATVTGFDTGTSIYTQPVYKVTDVRFDATGRVGTAWDANWTDDTNLHGIAVGQGITSTLFTDAGQGSFGNDSIAPNVAPYNAASGNGRVDVALSHGGATTTLTTGSTIVGATTVNATNHAQPVPIPKTWASSTWAGVPNLVYYEASIGDPDPSPYATTNPSAPTNPTDQGYLVEASNAALGPDFYEAYYFLQQPIAHDLTLNGTGSNLVAAGDTLSFRFYSSNPTNVMDDGSGTMVTGPDQVMAPITVTIEAETAAAMTVGSTVALGNVRIGESKTGTVSATSSGAAATNLYELTMGGATGEFTPVGAANLGKAVQGQTTGVDQETKTRDYTFTPTVANKGVQQETNIAISAIVGPADTDTLSGTAKITGTGVAPEMQVKLGTANVAEGGTITVGTGGNAAGLIRRGTAGVATAQLSAANLAAADAVNNTTTLTTGTVTRSTTDLTVSDLNGKTVVGKAAQGFSVALGTSATDALASKSASFEVATDQNAAYQNTTSANSKKFTYNVAGQVVSPLFEMRNNETAVANGGAFDLGNIRQNRGGSATQARVYNTYTGLGNDNDLTDLTTGTTGSSKADLTISGLNNKTINANNGYQGFNLSVSSNATGTTGNRNFGTITIATDQNAALGVTTGAVFAYDVTGTVVQSTMTGVDSKTSGVQFDYSGKEVVFDPLCPTCVGRIDLGNLSVPIHELIVRNLVSGSMEQVGLTLGEANISGGNGQFKTKNYTPGHQIAGLGFFGIELEYTPATATGGFLPLADPFLSAILTINTDNGAAFGATTLGTQYSFLLTNSGAAPAPGTLALMGAALLVPGLRRLRRKA